MTSTTEYVVIAAIVFVLIVALIVMYLRIRTYFRLLKAGVTGASAISASYHGDDTASRRLKNDAWTQATHAFDIRPYHTGTP
jgi:hypothetical protein